tara:strand:+ start:2231 stop:2479 length:249 start_codon:yes stop_codon:yes gene_type:complete
MTMSDHQDSEHFAGLRDEDEVLEMLDRAERKYNYHYTTYMSNGGRLDYGERMHHVKQIKALQGVIKTLRWCVGDKDIEHPLE